MKFLLLERMVNLTKAKFIALILAFFGIVSLLTYLNYEKILTFFTNRQWEIADSVGKIELENCLDTFGTNSAIFVVNGSGIQGYSNDAKKIFEKSIPYKDVVTSVAGDYTIVAEKNSTNVSVICKTEEIWSTSINNANILGVVINKNGYSAVIYSQAGYKSLIKIYSVKGEELITSYLASTYALDVAISNDNKTLAIAEIDTNGVSLESRIKLIDIQSASEDNVKRIDLDNNELISDIEYDNNNQLIVLTDTGTKILKNNMLHEWVNFGNENIIIADISNKKNLVAVKVSEEGLFSVKCKICIYQFGDTQNMKEYDIQETPSSIVTCEDTIAINTGNKIVFINTSGNFLKKSEYNGQLKDFNLFDNGKTAVLLFRDSAEFLKVGGI